jgi:hypothetical protein
MAGKKKLDPVSEAALDVVKMEQQREELAKQAQSDREIQVAECYQFVGRLQANRLSQKFLTVSNLVWLNHVKKNQIYKGMTENGTWVSFCNLIGFSDKKIDLDLQNLATFGEEFLLTCQEFSLSYRDLRKLRQLSHDGAVVIDAEAVVIGEERIPLDADHKEDLQAAIETIIEQQAAMKTEVEAQKKAFDRVQSDTRKSMTKLQKELDRFSGAAEAKGLTPVEDAFCQKCEAAQVTITSFLDQFDPAINPLPDDATPRMKAALMHTLAWFKRCIIASYDTAGDLYGDAEMDGNGWVPPHLRTPSEPEAAAVEAGETQFPNCRTCDFKKGMANPAKGVKIPGVGKCTRPEGLCYSSQAEHQEA